MHPVLIRLGPLTIHTYGFLVALGFLAGIGFAVWQAKKEGISTDRIIDLSFYILLAAIIGSRLLFIVINAGHYLANPLDIFKIWEGGLVFYGGVLLAAPDRRLVYKKGGSRSLEYCRHIRTLYCHRPCLWETRLLCSRLLLWNNFRGPSVEYRLYQPRMSRAAQCRIASRTAV